MKWSFLSKFSEIGLIFLTVNEVQFSWCVIINVGTHVGAKSVKTIMFKVHAFCGNLHLADNYTSAIYILIRQVISKNRFIFSMQ